MGRKKAARVFSPHPRPSHPPTHNTRLNQCVKIAVQVLLFIPKQQLPPHCLPPFSRLYYQVTPHTSHCPPLARYRSSVTSDIFVRYFHSIRSAALERKARPIPLLHAPGRGAGRALPSAPGQDRPSVPPDTSRTKAPGPVPAPEHSLLRGEQLSRGP